MFHLSKYIHYCRNNKFLFLDDTNNLELESHLRKEDIYSPLRNSCSGKLNTAICWDKHNNCLLLQGSSCNFHQSPKKTPLNNLGKNRYPICIPNRDLISLLFWCKFIYLMISKNLEYTFYTKKLMLKYSHWYHTHHTHLFYWTPNKMISKEDFQYQ